MTRRRFLAGAALAATVAALPSRAPRAATLTGFVIRLDGYGRVGAVVVLGEAGSLLSINADIYTL